MGKWNMICGTWDMGNSGNVDLGTSASQARHLLNGLVRV